MLVITLMNGDQYQYVKPISPLHLMKDINPILTKYCIAAQINGKIIDIIDLISHNVKLNFITVNDNDIGWNIIRHSCAQVLGYAIKQLWPQAKMLTSSVQETEFYYDIDLNINLIDTDLDILTQTMEKIINKKYNIIKKVVPLEKAKKIFQDREETYKVFLLNNISMNTEYITLYLHEEYIDINQGPHVPNVNFCRYFKLHNISETYSSDINVNKKLQRISGTAWFNDEKNHKISVYFNKSKELKKQDHRDLAYKLDLYHIQEDAPGMIFWHNNGYIIFQELKNFIRKKLRKYQYQEVKSPTMIDNMLWKKTGHWDNYYEHIFTTTSENRIYCIKPMNCPGHIQIFNQGIKSYKNLPLRVAEFGNCHRNEPSGSLHGLMRIREFTQDDAHIFCTPDQIQNELHHCIKMMYEIYHTFGFKKISVNLSTRPKKRIGKDILWDMTEQHLFTILNKHNISFQCQPYDGAFYGPKIEFALLDSVERSWQCGTIQLDFSSPDLLGAHYVDSDNKNKTPVMIHRAILGSIERFIGLLTEEYEGFFPTWLAPIQIVVMNVTSKHIPYVIDIAKTIGNENFRMKTDVSNEKISSKIRLYTIRRIPYMIICGDIEMHQHTISIRTFRGKEIKNCKIDIFLKKVHHEIYTYSLNQMED